MAKVTLNDLLDPYRIGSYRSTFQGYRRGKVSLLTNF